MNVSEVKLPKCWQTVRAIEICEGVTDGTHASPKPTSQGFPLITSVHLRNGVINFRDAYNISLEDYLLANKRSRVDQYDVLFSMIGSIGTVAFVADPPQFAIKNVGLFKTKREHDLGLWLYYFLQSENTKNFIRAHTSGTSQKYVPLWLLQNLPITLPPSSERSEIVRVLQAVQEVIQTRRDELKLEYERKAALMEYLFTNGTHGEPVKQTEIGEIPKSWKIGHLRDVIQNDPQNGAFVKQPLLGTGTLYVNVYDIYQSPAINLNTVERMECEPSFIARYALKENDILFVRSSLKREGIGQCCLVRKMEEPAIFDCHLIKVSPNTTTVVPLYLTYFFLSEHGRKKLIARSKTTTMTTINQNTLIDSLVPIPSLAEQREITQVLEACENKVAAEDQELTLLEELFRALLEELTTGHLSTLPLIEEGETHE